MKMRFTVRAPIKLTAVRFIGEKMTMVNIN
jgi:hypothetical protein